MTENKQVPQQMEQKIVKFEIGKLLAVVISIVVITGVAGLYLSSTYFKGSLGDAEQGALTPEQEVSLQGDCLSLSKTELEEKITSPYLTDEERILITSCLQEYGAVSYDYE